MLISQHPTLQIVYYVYTKRGWVAYDFQETISYVLHGTNNDEVGRQWIREFFQLQKRRDKRSRKLNKDTLRNRRKQETLSMQLRKQNTSKRYGFHGKDKRRRNDRRK